MTCTFPELWHRIERVSGEEIYTDYPPCNAKATHKGSGTRMCPKHAQAYRKLLHMKPERI